MFKNLLIFKIGADWEAPSLNEFELVLQKFTFAPIGATQKVSLGWVPPRGNKFDPLIESVGGHWILRLQAERKSVPGGVIKKELEKRCRKLEEETGRKVGRKEKKDIKLSIELELLPRAFSKTSSTPVWLSPEHGLLVVGTGSVKASDDVVNLLTEAFSHTGKAIPLGLIQTELSPSKAMSEWLIAQAAPGDFNLASDLELKSAEDKAAVRYARHSLELEEIKRHISEGKMPTQIALTWRDRVSFTLAANFGIKKLGFMDVALDDHESVDAGFDFDATVATAELSALIPDLVAAMGGELKL